MTDQSPPSTPKNLWISLALGSMLIASCFFLFYYDGPLSSSGSITAMIAIPFSLGGLVSQISSISSGYSLKGCLLYPVLAAIVLIGISALAMGEGAICTAILVVPWIVAAIGGGVVIWLQQFLSKSDDGNTFRASVLAVIPLTVFAVEGTTPPLWQTYEVSNEIVIDASAQEVWPLLVDIPAIGQEEGASNFTQDILGVPRPSDARLITRDGELVRMAQWGEHIRFEEQITQIEQGDMIGWNFHFPDDSLQQHTDRHIDPSGDMLVISKGRYNLVAMENGQTTVQLTTSYRMRTRMGFYLQFWGDQLIGDVQENVLTIIQDRAER